MDNILPYIGFALLPIAAASGWWFAQRSINKNRKQQFSLLSSEYFRGLNYLINQEQDRAIDLFSRMVNENPQMVETNLTLGTLFRRQGDTSQAIRIHDNLIRNTHLNDEQRSLALLELGRDYMKAGLLDHAEKPFLQLIKLKYHQQDAYERLVTIYQQEKEWDRAIKMLRNQQQATENNSPTIAQFLCEKAEIARKQDNVKEALRLTEQALNEDTKAVRANIIRAETFKQDNQIEKAIDSYKKIELQDTNYLREIIKPLLKLYRANKEPEEVFDYLMKLFKLHPSTTVLLATVEQIELMYDEKEAEIFLIKQLAKHPSVRGLEHLLKLNLSRSTDSTNQEELLGLQKLVKQLLEKKPEYQCSHCGFQAQKLHWQCPGCNNWNTIKPIVGVSGE